MAARLSDLMAYARRKRFTGREVERALFDEALAAEVLPFNVLVIYGPGGIGKTTLLQELQAICSARGIPACYVDARNIDPTPDAALRALQGERTSEVNPGADGRREVLLIDTFEAWRPLEPWLREQWLQELTADVFVVISGRDPPPHLHGVWSRLACAPADPVADTARRARNRDRRAHVAQRGRSRARIRGAE